jgi:hypothetical protein
MLAVEAVDGLTAFVVGCVGYRAGVDHAYVSLLACAYFCETLFGHLFPYRRRFGKVQFASKGVECHLLIVKYIIINHFITSKKHAAKVINFKEFFYTLWARVGNLQSTKLNI